MKRTSRPVVNSDQCNGCGLCQKVCPVDCLVVTEKKAKAVRKTCISCCHCEAVCPLDAITVDMGANVLSAFESFAECKPSSDTENYDTAALIRLLRSRRSSRNFSDKTVPLPVLRDLVRAGVYAPSATNSQGWSFSIVPDRETLQVFLNELVRVYSEINDMARKKMLRTMLKWVGKPELSHYYEEYYPFISKRLEEMISGGRDVFFRGATAAIFVCGPKTLHLHDDAWLATQNVLLTAHAMGLGTCLIGMANAAIRFDRNLKKIIDVPDGEVVYSVIAVGYPEISYKKLTQRYEPDIRVVSSK